MTRRTVFLTCFLVLVVAAPASAAPPSLPGVAVAERLWGADRLIVRVALDGSVDPVLTTAADRASHPKLSRDGRTIVYQAENATGRSEIWRMNLDGTDKTQVTRLGGYAREPAIDPTGQRVVFSYRPTDRVGFHLYSIAIGGGAVTRLTWGGRGNTEADFSPDGRTIAYTAFPSNAANGTPRVFLMDSDGTNKRKLSTANARRPDISPDGRRIAFEVGYDGFLNSHSFRIGTIDADGSDLWIERGEDERLYQSQPVWAPDSRRLLISYLRLGWDWALNVFTPPGLLGEETIVSNPGELPGSYYRPDWVPGTP